jgi:hypothetical protein
MMVGRLRCMLLTGVNSTFDLREIKELKSTIVGIVNSSFTCHGLGFDLHNDRHKRGLHGDDCTSQDLVADFFGDNSQILTLVVGDYNLSYA